KNREDNLAEKIALGIVVFMVAVKCKYDHARRVTEARIELIVVVTGIVKFTLVTAARIERPVSYGT
ncbi:hypothetical protein H0H92_011355, partial [Tricholoma furcatifolium]